MKLIKPSDDHYVVVDESIQPVNGFYYDAFVKAIRNTSEAEYGKSSHCWQITRSTQPLELICCTPVGQIKRYIDCKGCDRGTLGYNEVKPLSLSEVKELLGEVDTEQYAWDNPILSRKDVYELFNDVFKDKHIEGAYKISASKQVYQFNHKLRELAKQRVLEDNKDKKYTEDDMIEWAMCMIAQYVHGNTNIWNKDLLRESLPKPKTEWDVEFVDGKLKLKK